MKTTDSRMRGLLRRRWVKVLGGLLLLMMLAWFFRVALLQAMGNFLVTEDPPCPVDAVYVLGGASLERGIRAAHVHRQFPNTVFYFTGSNVHTELEAHGIRRDESEMAQEVTVREGVPATQCIPLHMGTSTMEEADAILIHARMMHYKTIAVLSSRYHMRRIDHVFTKRFAAAGITVKRIGAPTDRFDERFWWRSEDGLMAVNNEYVKLLYYWWKY